jgi:hypothetical protein
MSLDSDKPTPSLLTKRERRLLLYLMERKVHRERRRHVPHIQMISFWPTAVPKILAIPYDGSDTTPHLRCTPLRIAEAIRLAGVRRPPPDSDGIVDASRQEGAYGFSSPVPTDEWAAASESLIQMVDGGHFGAALMFTWNMASRWAFEHGKFAGENGKALQRQEGRDRIAKVGKQHGGPKPGSGRKPKVSLERALAAFQATNPNWKLSRRYEVASLQLGMQPEGLRKRLARSKVSSGQTV